MRTYLFKLLCVAGLLTACQEETDVLQIISNDTETIVTEPRQTDAFQASIDESEAKNVAALFISKNAKTRSISLEVDYVQAIIDKQSRTLMYAINFSNDKGYVLVSATKKYYPILAYAEQGHFDATQNGVNIWLEDEKNMIQTCLNDSTAAYNIQWLEYTDKKEQSAKRPTTRVESDLPQDIHWWWMEIGNEISNPDYHSSYEDDNAAPGELISSWWCHVDEAKNYFPSSGIYGEMASQCEAFGYTEEDVIYHFRTFSNTPGIKPLLTTNWKQGAPYNNKVKGKRLGHVTVATAQILNHHKKPSFYNWTEINIDGSATQGQFLKELGESLGNNYNTSTYGAKIEDAKRIFEQFGYTVKRAKICTTGDLNSALIHNKPVYMRGCTHQNLGADAGDKHTWVCDGYEEKNYSTVMTVYAPFKHYKPEDGMHTTNPFEEQWGYSAEQQSRTRYNHMNWGLDGCPNSWNRDGDYTATDGKTYHRNTEFLFIEP